MSLATETGLPLDAALPTVPRHSPATQHPRYHIPPPDPASWSCQTCDFALWTPLVRLTVSDVGLYDDSRFPARLLVTLHDHFDHLDEVPDALTAAFFCDIRVCSSLLRSEFGATRVNVAVLGNQVPHVHAHVIPRMTPDEPRPQDAPWRDPRPRAAMTKGQRDDVIDRLSRGFAEHRLV